MLRNFNNVGTPVELQIPAILTKHYVLSDITVGSVGADIKLLLPKSLEETYLKRLNGAHKDDRVSLA